MLRAERRLGANAVQIDGNEGFAAGSLRSGKSLGDLSFNRGVGLLNIAANAPLRRRLLPTAAAARQPHEVAPGVTGKRSRGPGGFSGLA